MDSRASAARSTSALGERAAPTVRPSGRRTPRVPLLSRAETAWARSESLVVRASTGASAAARLSASAMLCMRAWRNISMLSGTRKASAIIEVTASATPARDRLNGEPPS